MKRGHGLVENLFIAHRFDKRGEHAFDQIHHVVALHKRHFHIELGEFRLAVSPLIFIAETAGDLEVSLDPADHQQLFQLLRRLRQGIKFSGMHATRNEIITRAFGCGLEQDRRLDFDEAFVAQVFADERRDVVSQDQILFHPFTPQIEIAVFESQCLVHIRFFVDVKRRWLGGVENFNFGCLYFYRAGF